MRSRHRPATLLAAAIAQRIGSHPQPNGRHPARSRIPSVALIILSTPLIYPSVLISGIPPLEWFFVTIQSFLRLRDLLQFFFP